MKPYLHKIKSFLTESQVPALCETNSASLYYVTEIVLNSISSAICLNTSIVVQKLRLVAFILLHPKAMSLIHMYSQPCFTNTTLG